jgi:hypothetical protein
VGTEYKIVENHFEDPGVDGSITMERTLNMAGWPWGMDWFSLAQHKDKRHALVNTVMNLRDSIKSGEFVDWLRNG